MRTERRTGGGGNRAKHVDQVIVGPFPQVNCMKLLDFTANLEVTYKGQTSF